MDWITPEIAIGNQLDAADRALLLEQGVRAVFGLVPTLVGAARGLDHAGNTADPRPPPLVEANHGI